MSYSQSKADVPVWKLLPRTFTAHFNLTTSSVALILLVFARVVLVSDTEIVGQPYDTDLLAQLVLRDFWRWGTDPLRPPFAILVADLIRHTGIPWRMFLEAIFVAASLHLTSTLKNVVSPFVKVLLLALLLFNPYTIRSFTEFQREPLLLVLYIVWLSFCMRFVQSCRDVGNPSAVLQGIVLGAFGGAIILTREGEELFVGFGCFLTFALAIVCDPRVGQRPFLANGFRAAMLVAVPLIVIVAMLSATAYMNGLVWGVPHYRGVLGSYQSFLTQVHRIAVSDSTQYAPATRQSFALAAKASPTFSKYADPVFKESDPSPLGRAVAIWRNDSSAFVHRQEIDPTRSLWMIAETFGQYGPSAQLRAEKLDQATSELKAAFKRGDLPAHTLQLPYPFDPNIANWVAAVPSAIGVTTRMLLAPTSADGGVYARPDFNAAVFDAALNRRTALVASQYRGAHDRLREYIVYHYHWAAILIYVLIATSVALGGNKTNGALPLYTLIIVSILGVRATVYAVMYASVAPVDRYQAFTSPLTCMTAGLCCVAIVSAVRRIPISTTLKG